MIYFMGDNALFDHLRFYSETEIRKIDINIKKPVDFSDINQISRIILQLELNDLDSAYVIPFLKFFINPKIIIALAGFMPIQCCYNPIQMPIDQLFYIRLPASEKAMDSFMRYEAENFDPRKWEACRNRFNSRVSHIMRGFSTSDQLRYKDKLTKMMINF